jgi:hypothetical protein
MSYDIEKARAMLDFYIEAEIKVLEGKSISKDGRTWTRENLSEIRQGRREWMGIINGIIARKSGHSPGMALANFNHGHGD